MRSHALHRALARRSWIAITALALAACTPDLSGIHAAAGTGDLLQPPVPRGNALAAVRGACGVPERPSTSLARQPYVQHLDASAATVAWTSTASAPESLVLRVAPAGTPGSAVREVASEIAPTRYLAGARQHHARIEGLTPGTLHCYELGDASGARVFGPAGFRTAPAANDAHARVSLIALGDSGWGGYDQRAVAAQMQDVPHELTLHVGDVAYSDGTLNELETNHFAIYRDLASAIPLFPSIGDHDDATGDAGPYREVFARPRYYSFDWGPLHVLVLDAAGGGAAQREFAERDLAGTDRPWRIVVTHEPPYSSGIHGSSSTARREYVPLFERHGVQLVLSGDDHDYERSVPIAGVTYVVTGGGGRSVRPVGRSEWTAFSEMAFHFVHVEIDGDVMRVRAIDATGREFDGVEIPRTRG